jgi:hypothetical protein
MNYTITRRLVECLVASRSRPLIAKVWAGLEGFGVERSYRIGEEQVSEIKLACGITLQRSIYPMFGAWHTTLNMIYRSSPWRNFLAAGLSWVLRVYFGTMGLPTVDKLFVSWTARTYSEDHRSRD